MQSIPPLERLLDDHEITWAALDLHNYGLLWEQWSSKYGLMFQQQMRFKHGARARLAFEEARAEHCYVLSVPNGRLVPYVNPGRRFGYECRTDGNKAFLDFSPLHDYEFLLTPADFEWTIGPHPRG
jgi:hypothetical protein